VAALFLVSQNDPPSPLVRHLERAVDLSSNEPLSRSCLRLNHVYAIGPSHGPHPQQDAFRTPHGGEARLNGIASSADGSRIWVTYVGRLPGLADRQGGVIEVPAF